MISKKDSIILESLKDNSRKSIKEISKETNIPRATVFDRIKKMKKEKIINSFTIDINHEKLGLGTMGFILVKFTPQPKVPQLEVAKNIGKIHGVEEVYIISGDWDMLLKARTSTLKDLGELIVNKIRQVDGVAQTETCACFMTVK